MRIPEYHNDKHNLKTWSRKDDKVQKVHEDQFENELQDCVDKKTSKAKNKPNPKPPKEIGHEDKTRHETQSVSSRFSSWG